MKKYYAFFTNINKTSFCIVAIQNDVVIRKAQYHLGLLYYSDKKKLNELLQTNILLSYYSYPQLIEVDIDTVKFLNTIDNTTKTIQPNYIVQYDNIFITKYSDYKELRKKLSTNMFLDKSIINGTKKYFN